MALDVPDPGAQVALGVSDPGAQVALDVPDPRGQVALGVSDPGAQVALGMSDRGAQVALDVPDPRGQVALGVSDPGAQVALGMSDPGAQVALDVHDPGGQVALGAQVALGVPDPGAQVAWGGGRQVAAEDRLEEEGPDGARARAPVPSSREKLPERRLLRGRHPPGAEGAGARPAAKACQRRRPSPACSRLCHPTVDLGALPGGHGAHPSPRSGIQSPPRAARPLPPAPGRSEARGGARALGAGRRAAPSLPARRRRPRPVPVRVGGSPPAVAASGRRSGDCSSMARRAALALLIVGLLGALRAARGQDFDLLDALGGDEDKKPTTAPKKPSAGDDFDLNLEDALGGGGSNDPAAPNPPKPRPNPKPNQPGSSGGISDADLADGIPDGGGDDDRRPRKDGEEGEAPGVIPGIVGAIVVAVAGAISSFIAYQKKKFCFKENAEQGEVDMENTRNTNAEPPVQRTLLEK
ncbi:CD99 antigen [Cynocephalus volans]|uniref:CD99 antigen n=1 Tax=Cynocephalus volans TaxID=110931 RepID=UPI002FC9A8F9